MSAADIETLRLGYEASNRSDWDGVLHVMHPDIDFRTQLAGAYRGHAEVRRFLEGLQEPFEEVVVEPEEFFDRGTQIVVFLYMRARPRGSSAMVENRVGHLWTMRDGKADRCETFPRREEALEAAELQE